MSPVFFVSHPEVVIDPTMPVPKWRLADRGIRRMRSFAASPQLEGLVGVWASREAKAIEAAGLLAAQFGLAIDVHEGLGENDRSATGYLAPPDFGRLVDQFFARPGDSICGWERAIDAQERVSAAVDDVLHRSPEGPLAIISHGGVGTLLLCRFRGEPISRAADQPSQGHYWVFNRETRAVERDWRSIDMEHQPVV
jgi:broad specificity phosphatase PhoE